MGAEIRDPVVNDTNRKLPTLFTMPKRQDGVHESSVVKPRHSSPIHRLHVSLENTVGAPHALHRYEQPSVSRGHVERRVHKAETAPLRVGRRYLDEYRGRGRVCDDGAVAHAADLQEEVLHEGLVRRVVQYAQ